MIMNHLIGNQQVLRKISLYYININVFDILDSKVLESTIVGLNPMEIKTFQVTLQ